VKTALLKTLTNFSSLAALLVALVAFSSTFVLTNISQTQATLLIAAWIGGAYTFLKAFFENHFKKLHERSGNE
jgi:hypothetical protein